MSPDLLLAWRMDLPTLRLGAGRACLAVGAAALAAAAAFLVASWHERADAARECAADPRMLCGLGERIGADISAGFALAWLLGALPFVVAGALLLWPFPARQTIK